MLIVGPRTNKQRRSCTSASSRESQGVPTSTSCQDTHHASHVILSHHPCLPEEHEPRVSIRHLHLPPSRRREVVHRGAHCLPLHDPRAVVLQAPVLALPVHLARHAITFLVPSTFRHPPHFCHMSSSLAFKIIVTGKQPAGPELGPPRGEVLHNIGFRTRMPSSPSLILVG